MSSLNPRTELIHRERLASNVVSHLFLLRNVGPTCWFGWEVAAILDLCTTATSILKNNAGNECLVVNLVRKVVLYIFLGQNVKKLYFHYGSWRPFWKTWITKIAQGWHLDTLRNLQTGGLGSSILQRKKLYTPSPGIPPWLPDYKTTRIQKVLHFWAVLHQNSPVEYRYWVREYNSKIYRI